MIFTDQVSELLCERRASRARRMAGPFIKELIALVRPLALFYRLPDYLLADGIAAGLVQCSAHPHTVGFTRPNACSRGNSQGSSEAWCTCHQRIASWVGM